MNLARREPTGPTRIVRVEIHRSQHARAEVVETLDEFKRACGDPSLLNLVVLAMRPGGLFFSTFLEYTSYGPSTPSNDRFSIRVLEWDEMTYAVVSIPIGDRAKAEEAAARAELRIVDGVPTAFTAEGVCFFPIDGGNTFTLESLRPSYRGIADMKEARRLERAEVDAIEADYKRRLMEGN